jgi:hypothetical protein
MGANDRRSAWLNGSYHPQVQASRAVVDAAAVPPAAVRARRVLARDANAGGARGGRPASMALRFRSIPAHFPLNLHGI